MDGNSTKGEPSGHLSRSTPGSTRCAFVTGACGGLGSAVTERLAASSELVFAADTSLDRLALLEGRPGIVPLLADVTRSGDLAHARAAVEAVADGLDALVCCAGVFTAGPLVEASEASMMQALEVNLMGVSRTVRELFPLLARRSGVIVAVSSESARCAMPFNGPYTVSKYALEAYCDVLRRELQFVGVRVVIVQPGAFRTGFLDDARRSLGDSRAGSLFGAYLSRALQVLSHDRHTSMPPDRVAATVLRAVRSRRPRARYRVGNHPLRVALGKLPAAWADGLIRRYL